MGFSAPGLLPFVALAAIPLVIHLLSRLRLRQASFPSLLLLRTVRRERFSWIRLKEVLLLVLRTLALLGLLLALARPYLIRPVPGLGRAEDLVLVLDDSYSMSYAGRWHKCREVAAAVLRSLSPHRKAWLLTASHPEDAPRGLTKRQALVRLDSIVADDFSSPGFASPTLTKALERAVVLAEPTRASILVITDLQARILDPEWRPAPGVDLTLLDVAGTGFDNAGVVRVYPDDPFAVSGRPVRIRAELANYGPREVWRTAVLDIDGKREEKAVRIPARSRQTVTFETAVTAAGFHTGKVDLRSDSLPADDARHLAFHLPETTRILVLETDRVPGQLLIDALTADTSSGFLLSLSKLAELSRLDPRRYSALVVTDAARLTSSDWTRLGFYLRSGGAALLMYGDAGRIEPAGAAAPSGSLPAAGALIRHQGSVRPQGFVSVTELDTAHPILAPFGSSALAPVRVWAHTRLLPERSRVVARLSDGDPLIIENPENRLLAWSIGPTEECSDLVYKASFVPLLHRTLSYLTRLQLRNEYLVGDTIRFTLDRPGPVTVQTPEGRIRIEPQPLSGRQEAQVSDTRKPGFYALEAEAAPAAVASTGRAPIVAVNPLSGEGDLNKADLEELRSRGLRVKTEARPESSDLVGPLLYLAALAVATELALLLF